MNSAILVTEIKECISVSQLTELKHQKKCGRVFLSAIYVMDINSIPAALIDTEGKKPFVNPKLFVSEFRTRTNIEMRVLFVYCKVSSPMFLFWPNLLAEICLSLLRL